MLSRRTLAAGDARDRLDEELDALVDEVADADDGAAGQLAQRAERLEVQLRGATWACNEWGEDATITVRGLPTGTRSEVENRLDARRQQFVGGGDHPGDRVKFEAAAGLVDGPMLDAPLEWSEGDFDDELGRALAAVDELPIALTRWLQAEVSELSSLDSEDFRSFAERLAARRAE